MSFWESDTDEEPQLPDTPAAAALPHGWSYNELVGLPAEAVTLRAIASVHAGYAPDEQPIRFSVDDFDVYVNMEFVKERYPAYHNAVFLMQRRTGSLYKPSPKAADEFRALKRRIRRTVVQRLPITFTEDNTAFVLAGDDPENIRVVSSINRDVFIRVPWSQ
jgi:hypothetical protein